MKRICFGTYAKILLLCTSDGIMKIDLVGAILRSVGSCQMTSNAVNGLLDCRTGLPNGKGKNSLGNVIANAGTADIGEVSDYFSEEVVKRFIDPNRRRLLYCAIRTLIIEDDTIYEDTVVDLVNGTTKKALRTQSRLVLSHFLAGVFLYTVTVNNKVGVDTIPSITDEYVTSFAKESETIGFMPPRPSKTTLAGNKALFDEYLNRLQDFYGTVKTLLFQDTLMDFYDMYLPNDIALPSNVWFNIENETKHKFNRRLFMSSTTVLSAIGVTDLIHISNFLILKGTGGLGKSMMIRHLLLDAIKSFPSLSLVPIFVPLKEYRSFGGSLSEYIYSILKDRCESISEETYVNALKDGSFILLLDGIDEIDRNHSERFEKELNTFADKYPNNYYIMSSRPFHTFVSFARFITVELCPFTKEQALALIDKLDYEPEQPEVKAKFRTLLDSSLFYTHRSFVEIPLLLTIMLMTFKYFAEVPSKMHLFYRQAFLVLFRMHDSSKGAYTREFRSGLDVDAFSNLFSEICFRSYCDDKYEFMHTEFVLYFQASVQSAKLDIRITADDFLHDLCTCLCIMYDEGSKYHFVHRSFQEYFAALFMSRQSEDFLRKLGGFYEGRARSRLDQHIYGFQDDSTFSMLYDIMPDKVEAYVFVPFLEALIDECNNGDGYWTFLEKLYPHITYEINTSNSGTDMDSNSFIFGFIYDLTDIMYGEGYGTSDIPYDDMFVTALELPEAGWVESHEYSGDVWPIDGGVGWRLEIDVKQLRRLGRMHSDILELLDDDLFIYKTQYFYARHLLDELKAKHKSRQNDLLDLL